VLVLTMYDEASVLPLGSGRDVRYLNADGSAMRSPESSQIRSRKPGEEPPIGGDVCVDPTPVGEQIGAACHEA
jgi:hypothetical protein